MNSHITVEMYPLQLSGHKFFQIFIPVHVIYNFSKIPYTDFVFIPSTGIYYQVVPVREQQLSILKPELDGFAICLKKDDSLHQSFHLSENRRSSRNIPILSMLYAYRKSQ